MNHTIIITDPENNIIYQGTVELTQDGDLSTAVSAAFHQVRLNSDRPLWDVNIRIRPADSA